MTPETPPQEKPLATWERIEMFLLAEVGLGIGAGIGYAVASVQNDHLLQFGAIAVFIFLSTFSLFASLFSK